MHNALNKDSAGYCPKKYWYFLHQTNSKVFKNTVKYLKYFQKANKSKDCFLNFTHNQNESFEYWLLCMWKFRLFMHLTSLSPWARSPNFVHWQGVLARFTKHSHIVSLCAESGIPQLTCISFLLGRYFLKTFKILGMPKPSIRWLPSQTLAGGNLSQWRDPCLCWSLMLHWAVALGSASIAKSVPHGG